jgi:hypothetical protein
VPAPEPPVPIKTTGTDTVATSGAAAAASGTSLRPRRRAASAVGSALGPVFGSPTEGRRVRSGAEAFVFAAGDLPAILTAIGR